MANERIHFTPDDEDEDGINRVIALSEERGFKYSRSQALHWLLKKGIRLGLADELESAEVGQ